MKPQTAPSRRPFTRTLTIRTSRRCELKDVTEEIASTVHESGCTDAVCHLYVPHTTAGVLINEGDDPAVARDIEAALERLVPRSGSYTHAEGNADAHIKSSLIGVTQPVLVEDEQLVLGRWQAIYFVELDGPRHRHILARVS